MFKEVCLLDTKILKTFLTVVDCGSYSLAANRLNYSQSTITFHIKELENELNVVLFEKSGKKMILNDAGKEIIPSVKKVLLDIDHLKDYGSSGISGKLKIAVPESIVTYKLKESLKEFTEKAPNVQLDIQVLNCYKIFEAIKRNEVDVALQYDVFKSDESLEIFKIKDYEITVVGSNSLSKEDCDLVSENQRKEYASLQNDSDALFIKMFNRYLDDKNITIANKMNLYSIEAIKNSVESNLGIAVLPKFAVQNEIKENKLKELDINFDSNIITEVMILNKNHYQSKALKLFIDIIKRN